MFYSILQSAHSGLRWLVIISFLITIAVYFIKWLKNLQYFKPDRIIYIVTLSLLHLQLIVGFVLYFISPKVMFSDVTMKARIFRFYTIEHVLIMLIGIAIFTIGSVRIKKVDDNKTKLRTGLTYALISFFIILSAIPWPFYDFGNGWF